MWNNVDAGTKNERESIESKRHLTYVTRTENKIDVFYQINSTNIKTTYKLTDIITL